MPSTVRATRRHPRRPRRDVEPILRDLLLIEGIWTTQPPHWARTRKPAHLPTDRHLDVPPRTGRPLPRAWALLHRHRHQRPRRQRLGHRPQTRLHPPTATPTPVLTHAAPSDLARQPADRPPTTRSRLYRNAPDLPPGPGRAACQGPRCPRPRASPPRAGVRRLQSSPN